MFGYTIINTEYLDSLNRELDELRDQDENKLAYIEKLESQNIDLIYIKGTLEKERAELKAKEETDKAMMENDLSSADFSILQSSNPKLLSEIYTLLKSCQMHIITQSLKIRKVDGIAYRDGAVDALEIVKSKLKEIYQVVGKNKKKQEEE